MMKKIRYTYRQKLLICISSIFVFFASVLVVLQIMEDRNTKKFALASRLDSYVRVISRSQNLNEDLADILPEELRTTIIDKEGNVIYESSDLDESGQNHLLRPEVQAALHNGNGYSIRHSDTADCLYFYYARTSGNRIIRVALPYDKTVKQFFKPHNIFVFLVASLILVSVIVLILLSGYLGKGVTNLLKLHIQNSEKGVAVFSPGKNLEYANSKFVQYVNIILGAATKDLSIIWGNSHFAPLCSYLESSQPGMQQSPFSYIVDSSGKKFRIQVLVYPDMGFEVGIVDITEIQKNSILKQQMTSNISHELRTPVTSIRGFLETIISCPDMPDEKKQVFIVKAYNQTIRLSDLIRDMALISKIEESHDQLKKELVNLRTLSEEIFVEFHESVQEKHIVVENCLEAHLELVANKTLLYAVLRNLVENSIKYAGENVTLHLECYSEQDEYLHFTYYDTGTGVPEDHLVKIFERFHRISEGRTRDGGGSGLGLSIVRNAIAFHGGEITARNREDGGLQFFFTLKKS